jgi:pimeloyl-ACP methyl ester carboxylesterase
MNKINYLLIVLLALIYSASYSQSNCDSFDTPETIEVKERRETAQQRVNLVNDNTSQPTFIGDRVIFFTHGLGGSTTSWVKAGNWTQVNYKAISLRPTYSEYSLPDAGIDLHNLMVSMGDPHNTANNISDPNDNYVIAHSQGGLVARSTDKYYYDQNVPYIERRFGGLVTFGTPHNGAMIINNEQDIQAFAGESLAKLSEGPALELFEGNWFLDMLVPYVIPVSDIENAISALSSFVGDKVLPFALEDFLAPITSDYRVGAPELNSLNSYNSTIPKVTFFGVENDPVVWRTLFSLQDDINAYSVFGAANDDELVEKAITNQISYQSKYELYNDLFIELSNNDCAYWEWLISPVSFAICAILENDEQDALALRDAYYDGWQWWLDADDEYKALIGALTTTTEGQWWCFCENLNAVPPEITSYPIDNPDDCGGREGDRPPGELCWTEYQTSTTVTEEESDGVVVASSAIGNLDNVTGFKMMPGSNHQQMRNDVNTNICLEELYGGVHGAYFKIDPRN